jgi:hypothetical protein
MIASIPIALPLVMQVVLALGASFLAKEHHAIVTSIPALQDIASMSILCSVSPTLVRFSPKILRLAKLKLNLCVYFRVYFIG